MAERDKKVAVGAGTTAVGLGGLGTHLHNEGTIRESARWLRAGKRVKTGAKGAALIAGGAGAYALADRSIKKNQSAFGIDHGGQEISKGRLPYRLVKVPKHKISHEVGPSGPKRVKDALNRAGDTPITVKGIGRAAGRVAGGAGRVIEGHPGMSGTALLGGGGVAGYKLSQPKKKKS